MPFERESYLYARHQGVGDLSAADFVEWRSENDESTWTVKDAFDTWFSKVMERQVGG
jgi:hypothetical protein